jgi:hypothetical protein
MEIVIDVKETKIALMLELLRSMPGVKIKSPVSPKGQVLKDLEEAVENMQLVQDGKLEAIPIEALLNTV